MIAAPEDIIQYNRNRKLYKEHLQRVHEAHSSIDTAPPSSLGLQHLVTRLKKKQVSHLFYLIIYFLNLILFIVFLIVLFVS